MNGKEIKDYYKILGVDKSASDDEVKKAYRKLAKEWHPDRHKGNDKDSARKKFKEINEAYQILGDNEKRKQYDTFGQYVGSGGMPGGVNFEDLFGGGMGGARAGSPFEDLFDLFGGGFGKQRSSGQSRGNDLHYRLRLSFADSIKGVATKINVNANEACDKCSGSGAKPGTSKVTCPNCGGRGVTSQSQGFFSISHTCSRCLGEGTIIESPCPSCHGTGVKKKNKHITIKIPAGVENGSTLRFKGKGEAAPKASIAGDLYITADVENHPVFQRDHDDIHLNLPITVSEAALGSKIGVPTLNGKLTLKIPAGTVSGKIFRLKGKGVYSRHGFGDMYVKVFIIPPKKLSKKDKELLKDLDKVNGNPRDAIFNIVDKEKK